MVDKKKVEKAVKLLLEAVGEDVNREGLKDTPARVSRMYEELLAGMDASPEEHLTRQFSCDGSDLVLEKDISFYSMCELHMLPPNISVYSASALCTHCSNSIAVLPALP